MKTWIGVANNYIELSYLDILKLLLGRELRPQLPGELIIRQPTAYSAFNLAARPVSHPETDQSYRERLIASGALHDEDLRSVEIATGSALNRIGALYAIYRHPPPR